MSLEETRELVLVTGASGFLAMHVVQQCVRNGFKVRGTVRDLKDEKRVRPLMKMSSRFNLELVEADLLNKNCWSKVMKDVSYVIHTASPFPIAQPENDDDIIRPALEGTLNVMNAAFKAKVKRFVFTSSTATLVGYEREKDFNEEDWPEIEKVTRPYVKSKILAERAVWDFVQHKRDNNQRCFEAVVINPSFIIGPTLHEHQELFGTSELTILNIINSGEEELVPFFCMGVCDVRDVASAHVRALTSSSAVGHRHPLVSQPQWVTTKYLCEILAEEYDGVNRETEPGVPNKSTVDNSRMIHDLKVIPTPIRKSLVDMANRFHQLGLVKKKRAAEA